MYLECRDRTVVARFSERSSEYWRARAAIILLADGEIEYLDEECVIEATMQPGLELESCLDYIWEAMRDREKWTVTSKINPTYL